MQIIANISLSHAFAVNNQGFYTDKEKYNSYLIYIYIYIYTHTHTPTHTYVYNVYTFKINLNVSVLEDMAFDLHF